MESPPVASLTYPARVTGHCPKHNPTPQLLPTRPLWAPVWSVEQVVALRQHALKCALTAPLWVGGAPLQAIGPMALRPGDFGFEYKRSHHSRRQQGIWLGQSVQNLGREAYRGDARVLHGFLVTDVDSQHETISIIEAAYSADHEGIKEITMGFTEADPDTDAQADHLFYRFRDPTMGAMLVGLSRHWAAAGVNNFSTKNAMTAWLHTKSVRWTARQRLLHVARALQKAAPVPAMRGWGYYPVMCSEFLASVGAAAAMTLYCRDHNNMPLTPAALLGLVAGRAGSVFNCDPRGIVPMVLHARLANDAAVEPIGYIPARLRA